MLGYEMLEVLIPNKQQTEDPKTLNWNSGWPLHLKETLVVFWCSEGFNTPDMGGAKKRPSTFLWNAKNLEPSTMLPYR